MCQKNRPTIKPLMRKLLKKTVPLIYTYSRVLTKSDMASHPDEVVSSSQACEMEFEWDHFSMISFLDPWSDDSGRDIMSLNRGWNLNVFSDN